MAAFVTCLLCVVVIIRPQEFVQELAGVPLLHVLCVIILPSIVLDFCWGRVRLRMAPQIPVFFAFQVWSLLVTLIKRSDVWMPVLSSSAILTCIFIAVTIGFSTIEGIKLFAAMFLGCALVITGVAITQYLSPFECFLGVFDDRTGGKFIPDGRPCESARDCYTDYSNEYLCERGGLFDSRTVRGRVRYLGTLEDPNELSLMLSSALPFGLAFTEVHGRRRGSNGEARSAPHQSAAPAPSAGRRTGSGPIRRMLAAVLIGLAGFVVAITQSRTGLIVYLLVMGIYFIRHVGAWGVLLACVVAPPMLLFGGRSGSGADASAQERTELMYEAFDMLRRTKGMGVGAGQFTDESSISMTAHNSYLLAAAETGIVGVVLFGTFLYLCMKVPMALWFGNYRVSATTAKIAPALAISLCGVAVGIVFLSWTYEHVLYLLAGASCALYAVAKTEDPRIDVRLSRKEIVLVPAGIIAVLAAMYTGARLRL